MSAQVSVALLLFGRLRDSLGRDTVEVLAAPSATLQELLGACAARFPAGFLDGCLLAVGEEFCDAPAEATVSTLLDATGTRQAVEVALIPPVSGG